MQTDPKTNQEDTASKAIPFYNDPKKRSILFQIGTLLVVGLLAFYLISNTITNLEKQSIATGIGFLQKEAAFEIGESPIAYSAADTYGRALVVGFLNTLIVSFVGIVITILLGTLIGVARLSSNWLVSKLAGWYIELFQDIPVLLQLFFFFFFFYN
ncbi:MAG: ABC transporter permease subunit, partial [Deltaproteobacteria bacterium]|nr:ABC transporter permease subunit [Deltaproteobacteria bacterium]